MTLQEAYTKFASSMAAVEAAMSQAAAAARAMAEIDTPDIAGQIAERDVKRIRREWKYGWSPIGGSSSIGFTPPDTTPPPSVGEAPPVLPSWMLISLIWMGSGWAVTSQPFALA